MSGYYPLGCLLRFFLLLFKLHFISSILLCIVPLFLKICKFQVAYFVQCLKARPLCFSKLRRKLGKQEYRNEEGREWFDQKGDWYVLPIGRLYLYPFCEK